MGGVRKSSKIMKFILTISVCSVIFQDCMTPAQHPIIFNNFQDCVKTALIEMTNIMDVLDTDMVNKNQLGPQFKCMPLDKI